MASRLLQDSTNSHKMLNSEVEQHKRHWLICGQVVLVKMLVCSLLKLNFVEDLFIGPFWDTEVTENISKGKTSELIKSLDLTVLISIQVIEHGIEALSEWSSGNVFDSIEHPHSIIIVDESVTEDSCGLMCPQSQA
jgi:hypothetical protein